MKNEFVRAVKNDVWFTHDEAIERIMKSMDCNRIEAEKILKKMIEDGLERKWEYLQ